MQLWMLRASTTAATARMAWVPRASQTRFKIVSASCRDTPISVVKKINSALTIKTHKSATLPPCGPVSPSEETAGAHRRPWPLKELLVCAPGQQKSKAIDGDVAANPIEARQHRVGQRATVVCDGVGVCTKLIDEKPHDGLPVVTPVPVIILGIIQVEAEKMVERRAPMLRSRGRERQGVATDESSAHHEIEAGYHAVVAA